MKMAAVSTKLSKQQRIENLERAYAEHLKNPPERCDRKYTDELAIRFGVNKRTMRTALLMLAMHGGENETRSENKAD